MHQTPLGVNFPWNDKKVVFDFLGELQRVVFLLKVLGLRRYLKNIR